MSVILGAATLTVTTAIRDDLSVVGFDDNPLSRDQNRSFPTIHTDPTARGATSPSDLVVIQGTTPTHPDSTNPTIS